MNIEQFSDLTDGEILTWLEHNRWSKSWLHTELFPYLQRSEYTVPNLKFTIYDSAVPRNRRGLCYYVPLRQGMSLSPEDLDTLHTTIRDSFIGETTHDINSPLLHHKMLDVTGIDLQRFGRENINVVCPFADKIAVYGKHIRNIQINGYDIDINVAICVDRLVSQLDNNKSLVPMPAQLSQYCDDLTITATGAVIRAFGHTYVLSYTWLQGPEAKDIISILFNESV